MIAICAAMQWELRPVLRSLRGVRVARRSGPRIWLAEDRGDPVMVFRTGVGIDAAADATRLAMRLFSLRGVVNTGCAGALAPALGVGDVVCAQAVLGELHGVIWRAPTDGPLTFMLEEAARAAGIPPISGSVLTSGLPLVTCEAKTAAFARHAAVAVEMEGAAVARVAAEAGLPFASVRVILDDAATSLPAPGPASKTMFDFLRKMARATLSVQETKRFVRLARNAMAVDHTLGRLFNSWRRKNV